MTSTNVPPTNNNNANSQRETLDRFDRRLAYTLQSSINTLRDVFNPILALRESFDKMATTNDKAVGMGTTLTKFQSENSQALSKLTGSSFKLTEVLMEMRQYGLRENSDELNALAVRMRYTNQDIGSLIEVMGTMSKLSTDGNLLVDELATQNKDLAATYKVTNDSLIKAIQQLEGTIRKQSLFGDTGNIAKTIQLAAAVGGPVAQKEFQTLIQTLLNPENIQFRAMTGTMGIQTQLRGATPEQGFEILLKAAEQIQATSKAFIDGMGGDEFEFAANRILGAIGDPEAFVAAQALTNLSLRNQMKQMQAQGKTSEEMLKTQKQILDEGKDFPNQLMGTLNDRFIPLLESIKYGIVAGQAASLGRLFGGRIPLLGTLLTRLVPIAGIVGAVAPSLLNLAGSNLSNLFDNTIEKEQLNVQKQIAKNMEKPRETPNDISTKYLDFLVEQTERAKTIPAVSNNETRELIDAIKALIPELSGNTKAVRNVKQSLSTGMVK